METAFLYLSTLNTDSTFLTDASTRQSFERELSTLIDANTAVTALFHDTAKSSSSSSTADSALTLAKKFDIIAKHSTTTTTTTTTPSCRFTRRDLIEQIHIYNKYNQLPLAQLSYTLRDDADADEKKDNDEDDRTRLVISGTLKIYWNLKSQLRIASKWTRALASNEHFTPVHELNERKSKPVSSRDDSSLASSSPSVLDQSDDSPTTSPLSKGRSQTVRLRPGRQKKQRPALVLPHKSGQNTTNATTSADAEPTADGEEQMFIPSYGSASTIHIDNATTCRAAIAILLDKFHVPDICV